MPYATQADLTPSVIDGKTLQQLTDDLKTGDINAAIVTDALSKASGTIEIYCRERYKLPLQPTEELVDLCCKLAAFKLYGRKTGGIPEAVKQGNSDAMTMLRDIAAGRASLDQPLPVDGAAGTDQTASGNIVKSRKPQVFGDRNMRGFI